MRRKWQLPKMGTKRTVTKFLWRPMTLSTSPVPYAEKETRWLEQATWIEEWDRWRWEPMYWLDEEER